ncbi:MAG: helix-turn-helix domain-containing protein [Candidatus Woesearchaeota archaeon]|nr:helix-turn-helix domain-containing protein [Candidatus Woesearchaeota archaeon]
MSRESFLLVSLKEDKAKRLAEVVSNESCRKILDYLSEKEATETELAQHLNLPLSTVHYNLKNLTEAELVIVEEFHYSEKGKEVNHYKLANKYIIIAPKSTFGIKEKLKHILPVAVIVVAAAALIRVFSSGFGSQAFGAVKTDLVKTAATGASENALMAAPSAQSTAAYLTPPNIAMWFLFGALFAILVYAIWDWIRKK